MDPELRQVYNKFGGDGIKQNRRFDESQVQTDLTADRHMLVLIGLGSCVLAVRFMISCVTIVTHSESPRAQAPRVCVSCGPVPVPVTGMQMLLEIAVYYATWGMLAYVLTLGKSSASAR